MDCRHRAVGTCVEYADVPMTIPNATQMALEASAKFGREVENILVIIP